MTPAAILFDLDDTILTCEGGDFVQLWRTCVERFIQDFDGLDAKILFDEIRMVADHFWSDPVRHREGRLEIQKTRREIVIQAAENLNRPNANAAIALADHYHDKREGDVVPFDGAFEALQQIRDRSIPTALITNGGAEVQRSKIDKYDLARFFDLVIVEGEFGAGKPDPKVYRHALCELDASPGETWMIGDNLEWEVRVPQELGIFAVWHDHLGAGLPEGTTVAPDKIVHRISELVPML